MTDTLHGYRMLRTLGEGPRARVVLAHADDEEAVALKRYRAGVSAATVLGEVEALERAAGPHVVEVVDVALDESGAVVPVLRRLGSVSLGRLLAERATMTPGEAVTVLAPLASTLARVHDAGVLHGGIRADAVLFDDLGAPVLACFGRARVVEPNMSPADRASLPGFGDDRAAFTVLAAAVLDRVAGAEVLPIDDDPARFAERLFDWADAAPVRLSADPVQAGVPSRMLRTEPLDEPQPVPADLLGLPDWLTRHLPPDAVQTARSMLAPVSTALRTVRRPVWVVAAASLVAVVAAMLLVPGDAPVEPPAAATTPTSTPVIADPGPVGGDDPAAAAIALLQQRERCLRDLSVLCLDSVAQSGSGALDDDQAAIAAMQSGGEAPAAIEVDPAAVVLVERLGDSAIVALGAPVSGEHTQPASLLLMRGEAGWRIRQYLP